MAIVKKDYHSLFLIAQLDDISFYEKLFQVIGIVLATDQSMKCFTFILQGIYLDFKSTFTIFKEIS